jgi:hypothetical protein
VKQDEAAAEAEKLQKKTTRELKAAHNLYQKKIKEEAKALRECAAAARKKERDAATAQKSRDRPKRVSRTTSQGVVKKS